MSMSRLIFAAALSLGAALPLTSSGASAETTVIRSYDNGGRYDNGEGAVVVRRHSDHGYHHGWESPPRGLWHEQLPDGDGSPRKRSR